MRKLRTEMGTKDLARAACTSTRNQLYSSLAELQLNHISKVGKAAFLHVPKDNSPEVIQLGADVVTVYITTLVDQLSSQSNSEKSEL